MKCAMCGSVLEQTQDAVFVLAESFARRAYVANVHRHCLVELTGRAAINRIEGMMVKRGWKQDELPLFEVSLDQP